jgi:hypothetical protein
MKKAMQIMAKIITVLLILFLVWLGLSFIEIVIKNLDNPTYSNLNLFKIFILDRI